MLGNDALSTLYATTKMMRAMKYVACIHFEDIASVQCINSSLCIHMQHVHN